MCLCFKTNKLIRIPTRKNNYLYDALGQKVRKVITDNPQITTTDYQGIFHYENEVLNFFATAEGYVNVLKKGNKTAYNYVYNYTDHLGNIRVSYTSGTGGVATIMEENHYYPFGLKHKKYGSTVKDLVEVEDGEDYYVGIEIVPPGARKTYQYKYNSKEWQDELNLNLYDYGARNYDPAIGRWINPDPLSEEYRRWSPYNYVMNSPLRFVDPDGMRVSYGDFIDNAGRENRQDNNDEPPVNFFAEYESLTFQNVFREQNKSKNYKIGDNIFSVYGHGNYGFLSDRKGEDAAGVLNNAGKFDAAMSKKSSAYKKAIANNEEFTLYLYTCMSASSSEWAPVSIAQQISQKHTNATVVGFDGFVLYGSKNGASAIVGVSTVKSDSSAKPPVKSNNDGFVVFYQNGKEIKRIPASEYFK